MAIDKFSEGGGKAETKKRARLSRVIEDDELFEDNVPQRKEKRDNGWINLVIVSVVILAIVGLFFSYTKDKISKVKEDGQGLEQEVEYLKTELANLQQKAEVLEKDSLTNKSALLDLFEKQRTIPEEVNITDWNLLTDEKIPFTLSFPKSWERVNVIIGEPEVENVVYLQPVASSDFSNAITLRTDYEEYFSLEIEKKKELFADLNLIYQKDATDFSLLYFINIDRHNREIPTVLILTTDKIYRATFNISDKKINNYFEYRKNFEEIMGTFKLVVLEKETDEKSEEENKTEN